MLTKMCARCGKVIQYPDTYCPECKEVMDKIMECNKARRDKKYNRGRAAEYGRFYHSKAWQALRAKKLADVGYLCEDCREQGRDTIAEDVHHVKEITTPEGWAERYNYDLLRALCVRHHNRQHGRF